MTIGAYAQDDASAKGVGASIAMDNNVNIAAGVGLNVVNATNEAFVGSGSVIKGKGITIEAKTPASTTDDFIAWGASAGGGEGNVGIAGSVGINVVNRFDTMAYADTGSHLESSAGISVTAQANLDPQTLAAAGAFSEGDSIGATVTVAVLNASTSAYIAGDADAAGALSIDAENHLDPTQIDIPKLPDSLKPSATSVAVAGAAAEGDVAVGGSFIVNDFNLNAYAYVGPSSKINQAGLYTPTNSQTVSVHAVNETTITSIAGALGAATGSAGVGVGVDVEILNKHTHAYIDHNAQVGAGGAVTVKAESSETMLSIAATVGVADDVGVAASISIADIHTDTDAYVGNAAVIQAGGGVSVSSTSAFKTTMIAGSVGAAGTAGIGVANTTLAHSATTQAYIGSSGTVTAAGTVSLSATAGEDILSIAAGIAGGGDAAVAGSAAVNVLNETTTAYVGPGSTITTTNGGGLTVTASDTTSVISVAGSLAASGTAGVGVGADVGVYTKHTNAYIDSGVTATIAGNIVVDAESSETLISVSAGLGVGTVGVAVNAGVHVFNLTTRAFIGDDPNNPSGAGAGNVHATGSVGVSANDVTDINEIVAVLAAGEVGVGAAAGVDTMTKDTESFIGAGASVTGDGNGSGLTVDTGRIDTSTVSAPTFQPGSGGQFDGASAVSAAQGTINLGTTPSGLNTGDEVVYRNGGGTSVGGLTDGQTYYVKAMGGGQFKLYNSAQNAENNTNAIALSQGVGNNQTLKGIQGIETSNAGTLTSAASGNRSSFQSAGQVNTPQIAPMDLSGNGSSQSVSDDSLSGRRSASPDTQSGFHGVAIGATNRDEVRTFTFSLAGGIVGVAVSAGVDVVNATTKAYIGNGATVNASTASASSVQSVLVGAGDDFYHLSVAGAAAFGAVGVAPAVAVNVLTNTTNAYIGDNATVNALNGIAIEATGKENVVMIGFGISGGLVAVGATVGVLSIDNHVLASVGDSATVYAGGDVFVSAQDDTHVLELEGALAGGFVGVGGAVGVMMVTKDTEATIGASAKVDALGSGSGTSGVLDGTITSTPQFETTTGHGVIVQAQSSENITHIVAAGAGGFVGVSGAVGVTLLKGETDAVIQGSAMINGQHQGQANANQDVYVNAGDNATVQTFVIGIAGGFVGVSGAIDVGNLNDNTEALVDSGASVKAKNNVEINAVALKNIHGFDASGAGGFVGVGGAVSVWSVGTQIQKSTKDQNGNDTGSAVNSKNGSADDNAAGQAQSGTGLVTSGSGGGINSFSGDGSGNSNTNTNRINAATQEAAGNVNAGAPSQQAISNMENNAPATPPGTSADIQSGATVTAGGAIGVKANESDSFTILVGQVSAGFVGAGASVAIVSWRITSRPLPTAPSAPAAPSA